MTCLKVENPTKIAEQLLYTDKNYTQLGLSLEAGTIFVTIILMTCLKVENPTKISRQLHW